MIGFTAGIAIGAAMDNNYYYGPYGWRGGGYMYNDAWDDYYDNREDAREDWQDHREDLADERGDRASDAREQRDRTAADRAAAAHGGPADASAEESGGAGSARREAHGSPGGNRADPGRRHEPGGPRDKAASTDRDGPGTKRHEVGCVFGLFERKVGARL